MNKKEFAKKVAQKTELTIETATVAIDAVFDVITENLQQGEPTVLRGVGSFSVVKYAERNGINPATKQPIKIPARKVVKFSASRNIEIKE